MVFLRHGQNPRWRLFGKFSRHMTKSSHVSYLKGNIFGRNIYPPTFIVIVLILIELRRGIHPHPLTEKTKKARSEKGLKPSQIRQKSLQNQTKNVRFLSYIYATNLISKYFSSLKLTKIKYHWNYSTSDLHPNTVISGHVYTDYFWKSKLKVYQPY